MWYIVYWFLNHPHPVYSKVSVWITWSFPPQVKRRRSSEALGPGAETLQSLSIRNGTDHRLCSLCVQREGTSQIIWSSVSVRCISIWILTCFLFPLCCIRVKSWWAPETQRSLKWGRRTQRATSWWTATWTGRSGAWPRIRPGMCFCPLQRTALFACGTSLIRSATLPVNHSLTYFISLGRVGEVVRCFSCVSLWVNRRCWIRWTWATRRTPSATVLRGTWWPSAWRTESSSSCWWPHSKSGARKGIGAPLSRISGSDGWVAPFKQKLGCKENIVVFCQKSGFM